MVAPAFARHVLLVAALEAQRQPDEAWGRRLPPGSIVAKVLEALQDGPGTARELALRTRTPKNSITTTLARLGRKGVLAKDGITWRLA